MKLKASTLPAMILILILALLVIAGCQRTDVEHAAAVEETKSKDAPATASSADDEPAVTEEGAEARAGSGAAVAKSGGAEARAGNGKAKAGDVVAGDGKARAGDVVAVDDGAEERGDAGADPGEVRVKIDGESGTRFSGACAVGDEGREVSGQIPGLFVYEPEGREVECEIRKEGKDAGSLKFSVDAGGENSKQKIRATADNLEFSVSGGSVSYTTSSTSAGSSSSSSVVQRSSVNSSSYSSSSSSSSSSSP